jgi:hypothetical protein
VCAALAFPLQLLHHDGSHLARHSYDLGPIVGPVVHGAEQEWGNPLKAWRVSQGASSASEIAVRLQPGNGVESMPDPVVPRLGAPSFSCPHCGAMAAQSWFRLYLEGYDKGDSPFVLPREKVLAGEPSRLPEERRASFEALQTRIAKNEITYDVHNDYSRLTTFMVNACVSMCYACDAFAFWIKDQICFPITKSEIRPPQDLPASIRDDFEEAAAVLELSPRSSAALLRLCIQKLMMELGQKGKNLNEDIGVLVSQGLDPGVQKALDVVRVVGNNAVHPGQIDLKDDKAIALTLFQLLNLITERCITLPKKLDEMYANLPRGALEQIERRDRGQGGD